MSKRVKSKQFLSDDSNSGSEDEQPKATKKPKQAEKSEKKAKTSNEGDADSWELGNRKKVTISEFRGTSYVNIREYYEDKETGEEKPGRKGIVLNRRQWDEFYKVVNEVNEKFTK